MSYFLIAVPFLFTMTSQSRPTLQAAKFAVRLKLGSKKKLKSMVPDKARQSSKKDKEDTTPTKEASKPEPAPEPVPEKPELMAVEGCTIMNGMKRRFLSSPNKSTLKVGRVGNPTELRS